ncbi:serine/threonine-protein kinase [Dactylosporangium sp. CA-139066]|uniref:serine/threonine-protein kinase n=1 Tax=Dactylosporangium sp. CA-139066 TaxID=3239930 RepID=UPI003D8C4E69
MTVPGGGPGEEPPTTLDPGRARPDDADVTVLDPGRRRRVPTGGPALAQGLPAGLDARFKVIRLLSRPAAPAEVYQVQERATGVEHVLKLYREHEPDREVRDLLARTRSRHLVRPSETGEEGGLPYELMEYLGGGSLTALRERNPGGLDPAVLHAVAGQARHALVALHELGVVHRDVKPANIVLRSLDPFEAVLVDFGLAQRVAASGELTEDRSGTTRYMPPEFIGGGMVSPAYDWWSFGITLLELATGAPLLPGIEDDNALRAYIAGGVDASSVVDPRLRMLCQGLLGSSTAARWGADEVQQWLDGGSPGVPNPAPPAASEEAEAPEPFVYLDVAYRHRRHLALAMTATWETAVSQFFGADPAPLARLEAWLRGLPGPPPPRSDPREPADVRLLRLLRWMAPGLPPMYRGLNIAWGTLPELGHRAAGGEGTHPDLVRELWRHDLLPLLDAGAALDDPGGPAGGGGLAQVRARWEEQQRRWAAIAGQIADDGARAALQVGRGDAGREAYDRMLAVTLWAATMNDTERRQARRELLGVERRCRLPWFTELVGRPDGLAVAYRLRAYAEDRAAAAAEEERAAARRRAWLRRNQTLREWSRRQNRPLALSWAVAGVVALAALCTLFIGVSDIANWASDGAILDAWLALVLAAAVALTFESLLAWEIGGRFHPRYSMLGAGMIALGRAARSIAGRGIALLVIVALVVGGYLLTVLAPLATPLVAGAAVVVWAVWRYLRWRADAAEERRDIDRNIREQRAAAAR